MSFLNYRTLIIGIGGTGFQCLSRIKEKTRALYGDIPSGIQFCALDTGSLSDNNHNYDKLFGKESSINSVDPYETNEWLKVTKNGVLNYKYKLEHPEEFDDLRFVNTKKLLNQIRSIDFSQGAGQKRVLGKIAFYFHYNDIRRKILAKINELSTNNVDGVIDDNRLNVYIVGSIAGGTGSGFLLDTIILVEELLNEINLKTEVYTFNLLPDIFMKENSGVGKSNVYPNAFAALCELEYVYEKLEDFIPTRGVNNLSDLDIELPKQNFLIDNIVLNGVDIDHKAMINATAQVISSICRADFGQGTQAGNSDNNLNPDPHNKPKRFSSLGYSEIFFDEKKLLKYTVAKIVEKSWKEYNQRANSTKNNLQTSLEQLQNLISNYEENLLETSTKEDVNTASFESVVFVKPRVNLKTRARLRTEMDTSLEKFSNNIKNVVSTKYQNTVFENFIENSILKMTNASNDKAKVKNQLQSMLEHLKSLKDYLITDINNIENLNAEFKTQYERHLKNLTSKTPPRFINFLGMTKKAKYKSFLNNELRNVAAIVNDKYRKILKLEEVNRLINNDLEHCIQMLNNDEVEFNTTKINELLKQQQVEELEKSSHNIIHLESYFSKTIANAIAEDHNIGKQLIEGYLNGDIEDLTHYITSQSNLTPIAYLNQLLDNDIAQLKTLLNQEQITDITGRLTRTANPLWNRADDYELTKGESGDAIKSQDLNKYKFLEVPNKEGDYFGKGTLDIRVGDIIQSDHKHRQSFIVIEEGLPAYHFKTLKKYHEELERRMDGNPDFTVQNFVYDDLREKFINGEIGPYIFNKI